MTGTANQDKHVKDGVIEIQGEKIELLLEELKKRGLKAKRG